MSIGAETEPGFEREQTIGDELRIARERAGLSIDDVAAHLRFRPEFLKALEDGQTEDLPGIAYGIGYVRSYAAFLGMDGEAAITRFKASTGNIGSRTNLAFPSPAPEGKVPGLSLMLLALIVAGGAYGGWYFYSQEGQSLVEMVPAVPERLATLTEPSETTANSPLPQSSVPAVVQPPVSGQVATAPAPATEEAPSPLVAETETETQTDAETPHPIAVPAEVAASDADEPQAAETEGSPSVEPSAVEQVVDASNGVETTPPTPQIASTESSVESAPTTEPAEETAAVPSTETASVPSTPSSDPALQAVGGLTPGERTGSQQVAATTPSTSAIPSAPNLSSLISQSQAAVQATEEATSRIVLRATGDSWVQVRDENGVAVMTRVLRKGDTYQVPEQEGLVLATGNAGALDILVDGNALASLGDFGQVVRNIPLDPEKLLTQFPN